MDLSLLCQSLSLSDDEDIVECELGNEARLVGEQKVANSLIGKVLSTKKLNREGIIQAVNSMWRTKNALVVEMVDVNTFVFHFNSSEDKRRVTRGGPWKFHENIIVLENPVGIGDHKLMKFNLVSFWIQIHNLPLMCMKKEAGLSLGSQLGVVEEVDPGASGDCIGKYMRVRVVVNISKPLKRGLKVKIDSHGTVITAILRYERLPDLCLNCGIIGHPLAECSLSKGEILKYNEFIKAGPLQKNNVTFKRARGISEREEEVGEDLMNQSSPAATMLNHSQAVTAWKISGKKNMGVDEFSGGEKGKFALMKEVNISSKNGNFEFQKSNFSKEGMSNSVTDLVEVNVNKVMESNGKDLFDRLNLKDLGVVKIFDKGSSSGNAGGNLASGDLIEVEVDKATESKGKEILAKSNLFFQKSAEDVMGYLESRPKIGKKGPKKTNKILSPKNKISKGSKKKTVSLGNPLSLMILKGGPEDGDSGEKKTPALLWIDEMGVKTPPLYQRRSLLGRTAENNEYLLLERSGYGLP